MVQSAWVVQSLSIAQLLNCKGLNRKLDNYIPSYLLVAWNVQLPIINIMTLFSS